MDKGVFCISLDFEKYWGIHDVCTWQEKESQFKNLEKTVIRLINLLEQHQIHCTWAVVGLLAEPDAIKLHAHSEIPYKNKSYSPFPLSSKKYTGIQSYLISANHEIELLKKSEFQEVASHTYSHYYSLEEGPTDADFVLDLDRMQTVINQPLKSIVFPRNQINARHLELCHKSGFTCYRGNQESKPWNNSTFEDEGLLKKTMRWSDAYFKLAKTNSYRVQDLQKKQGLVNIPASRFFRPYGSSSFLEKQKMKRIKTEMETAAKNNKIYHLWWHPHNLTNQTELVFKQLAELINHYKKLNQQYGFTTLNMSEIADYVK